MVVVDVSYVEVHISREVGSLQPSRLSYTDRSLFADCPQNSGPMPGRGPGSGANAAPTGPRRMGPPRDSGSWRDEPDSGFPSSTPTGPKDRGAPNRGSEQRDSRGGNAGYNDRDSRGGDRGGRYKEFDSQRDSHRRRSRSPSGSRSPPPPRRSGYRDEEHGRKERRRSRDRSIDREYRDKRRRVD